MKALVIILGTIGKNKDNKFKEVGYYFNESIIKDCKTVNYVNSLPLYIDSIGKTYNIIPLYTVDALEKQKEVLRHHNIDFDIENNGYLIDENNFDGTFNTVNEILKDEKYNEVIIDVSHGFRHLPLLATVSMMITNFQFPNKIKHVLFAKEIKKFELYEVIDLDEYLNLANIAFLLSAFEHNYTLANHVISKKYKILTEALSEFSNDIMSLNLNNLFRKSSKCVVKELDKIENIAIKTQAMSLSLKIKKTFSTEDKRYMTYNKLAQDLYEKNYLLLSLAMLYESIRLYIKTTIKQDEKAIVEKVEKFFNNDLYKVGDFFRKLTWRSHGKLDNKKDPQLSIDEYNKLKKAFPSYIKSLLEDIDNKRNNLAHGNVKNTFQQIKEDIKDLLEEYEEKCIAKKSTNSLIDHFGQR